ncbi:hypothetical protein [Myxacorys almedinensis]|uniref:Uncharacterized protein n=1 Tax=Myxacorys almedinensis A TaxID=2690445 RepID=A0A8J7ZC43_9CYAN|nr:hypothetical protein [Myxacorys almedinensis]NDJ19230.1 hypothetical protein [Myxacorys almedinensis A]
MASHGRYQSHLLSFVSRQRQKLAGRASVALRQAKLATLWSAQILLYPVYAAYQTTRLIGRQLKQTVERVRVSLKLGQASSRATPERFEIDTPIYQVLAAVKHIVHPDLHEPKVHVEKPRWNVGFLRLPVTAVRRLLSPESVNLSNALAEVSPAPLTLASPAISPQTAEPKTAPSRLPIQAIASLLQTRSLVLILNGNVIFDILTPDQQHTIEQRIIFELALSRHWYKKQHLSARSTSPLPLPSDRSTLIAPVRVFRQLMVWVQTGPVAIATNLFQESALIPTHTSDGTLIQSARELDWFAPNISGSDVRSDVQVWHLIPRSLPSSRDLKTAFGQLPKWSDLEALVWAAIHYFFGTPERHFAASYPSLSGTADSSPHLATAQPRSNWLSWSDVFDRPPLPPRKLSQTVAIAQPEPFLQMRSGEGATFPLDPPSRLGVALPPQPKISLGQSFKRWLQRHFSSQTSVVVHHPSEPVEGEIERSDLSFVNPSEIDRVNRRDRQRQSARVSINATLPLDLPPSADAKSVEVHTPDSPTHSPDWIDTVAIATGYVKSPFQKIMGWLDRVVSWVEATLIAGWNWLTGKKS